MERITLMESFLKKMDKNSIAVEIGTDEGNFSEKILNANENITLYCIDPYISYDDYKDAINTKTGDELFKKTYNKLKSKYGERVKFIRNFSSDKSTIENIPPIDFLYIDGNHSYKYVLEDLENYYPKVKNGGIIMGDDAVDLDESKRDCNGDVLINWSYNCYGYYGVVNAFNNFIKLNKIQGSLIGNQFVIKK